MFTPHVLPEVDALQKKWEPILNADGPAPIRDAYRRLCTAVMLENTENAIREEGSPKVPGLQFLSEGIPPVNNLGGSSSDPSGGAYDLFDPILISMVRRAAPVLVAYDLVGVQPMTAPTGLVFALRSRYANTTAGNAETFYNEVDTLFSGLGAYNLGVSNTQLGNGHIGTIFANTTTSNIANAAELGIYNFAGAMSRTQAETLGTYAAGNSTFHGAVENPFAQMAFSIEKTTVTAKTRALAAEYTMELAQDLKAVHGLNARAELINILSTEILAEINREVVRTVNLAATIGAEENTTNRGIFDLDTDSNGRWLVEKFKGMMFQFDREANALAKATRRGKGNIAIMTSDVASALQSAGVLDYAPALNKNDGNVPDDTGNSFVGVLNGRIRVYIDPYATGGQYVTVGYRGSSPWDAGLYYCPYVPLQLLNAVRPESFTPRIGFKTRYGIISNPFAQGLTASSTGAVVVDTNVYYRKVLVRNLM
jgi:hypothetical protein